VKFKVLGSFEVSDNNLLLTPTAPKLRTVLSLFVMNHSRVVPVSSLIEEIWSENPPVSAMTTLQTYVYQLRKTFGAYAQRADDILITKPLGYVAAIDPEDLDLYRFERLAEDGRRRLAGGEYEDAAKSLQQALDLCRGDALADVQRGPLLEAQATRLNESMRQVMVLRIEADLQLGRHRDLISELRQLTAQYPLYEDLHAKLMIALYRSDWKSAALEAFHGLRQILDNELGLDPSPSLQRLHHDILSDALSLQWDPQATRRVIAAAGTVKPAQIPSDTNDFVGRVPELAQIEEMLDAPREAARVILLAGSAGMGKTALALRAAHRARSRYPDGQLYAQLGGSAGEPAEPGDVLAGFLRALGASSADIPPCPSDRARLFRSLGADRAGLLVLDDAVSTDQVMPLLPGGSRWAVLITSRRPLSGLAGMIRVRLAPQSVEDGIQLLSNVAGGGRVGAELEEAAAIVRLCGRLPLAIRAAGQRLAGAPHWRLADLRARLTDRSQRLDELSLPDLDLRDRFASSYQALADDDRAVLARLADSRDFHYTCIRAARLLGVEARRAEDILQRLADANVLRIVVPGDRQTAQYHLPLLLGLYVREQEAVAPSRPGSAARPAGRHPLQRPLTA
jgi:DNA-binding SARP family transcriptional activator